MEMVDSPVDSPEESEELQREAEDAVVRNAMQSIGPAASGNAAEQRHSDGAYSHLLDGSVPTPTAGFEQAGRPSGASLLTGSANAQTVAQPESATAVPATNPSPPISFGPGGSSSAGPAVLPSNPLNLADTLAAVHEDDNDAGIRRVLDEVSTDEKALGQAEPKQHRAWRGAKGSQA